jgi:E3 ubiquitin-protein ligase RBBP6
MPNVKENITEKKPPVNQPQQSSEKNRSTKTASPLEATHECMSTKEPLSQESAPMVEEEVQQKFPVGEPGSYCLAGLLGCFFWIYCFVDFCYPQ